MFLSSNLMIKILFAIAALLVIDVLSLSLPEAHLPRSIKHKQEGMLSEKRPSKPPASWLGKSVPPRGKRRSDAQKEDYFGGSLTCLGTNGCARKKARALLDERGDADGILSAYPYSKKRQYPGGTPSPFCGDECREKNKARKQRRDPPDGQASSPHIGPRARKVRARRLGRGEGEVQPATFQRAAAALQAQKAEAEAETPATARNADAEIDLYARVAEEEAI